MNRLRFELPADQVLVTSRGQPFISVADYNAWLGTYPLSITSEDAAQARKQAAEQMVAFKLLAARARQTGYLAPTMPAAASEKALVLSYIRDQMSNPTAVTDAQAREYTAAHPDQAAAVGAAGLPDEVMLALAKGAVLGERLGARLRTWTEEAGLGYAPEFDPNAASEVAP